MIDKLTPKKFVADKDQRLIQPGEMTVAENVTIVDRGQGTEFVLKTMKGTTSATAVVPEEDAVDAAVTVIGSVADEQRGFVYFFVASDTGHDSDAIYQYDTSEDTYKKVLKSSLLNFDKTGFVKADVLNKSFKRDGDLETVIYFTDNNNPPRKINVDRALDGEYNEHLSTQDSFDIALGAMRAASTTPPTFRFETDTSSKENNFEQNQFQFATQIVYKDGEVSALSPYSKLAISQASVFGGIEDTDYGGNRNYQNVCVIRHNVDLNHPDMKKIRLIARKGNSGAFFIINEFDPNENLSRSVMSSNQNVYDSSTREYKFYNDSFGSVIPDLEAQKLYDNVPQKAEGQSITSSRLMYSNYTEGYENVDIHSSVDINPVYSTSIEGASSYVGSGDIALIFDHAAGSLDIDLDLEDASSPGIDNTTSFPAGSLVVISFVFKPTFTAEITTGTRLMRFDMIQDERDDPLYVQQYGEWRVDTADFNTLHSSTNSEKFEMIERIPNEMNSIELANFIQSKLDEQTPITLRYTLSDVVATAFGGTIDDGTFGADAYVTFKFGEVSTSTDDTIQIKPRITNIRLENFTPGAGGGGTDFFLDPGGTTVGSAESFAGANQNEVTYTSVSDPTNTSEDFISIDSTGAVASFKAGANHSFGIVYYDKYGRSGHVNELGNVYAKAIPERPTTPGSVAMEFNLESTGFDAPSWAESYQIVYGGSSVADVFQYTVGPAYVRKLSTIHQNNAHTYNIDETVHNIYVSLKTLEHYRRDKDVIKNYSFTKGDKLRIIARRNDDDTGWVYNPLSSDGNIIEFDVVGLETFEGAVNHDGDELTQKDNLTFDSNSVNPYKGDFLVLTAPAVEGTAGNAGAVEKYEGFDWYQLTSENYNNTDSLDSVANYWNRNVLIEIITPKKSTEEKIYYEIGERKPIVVSGRIDPSIGEHGRRFTVSSGDVYFRPVACKTPTYDTDNTRWRYAIDENPETWEYQTRHIEDSSVSDLFDSKAWDRGRPHVVFDDAATVNRFNSITYSDAYVDDSGILALSSFNAATANFFDLPSEHGACKSLANVSEYLFALQERKIQRLGINKSILSSAQGQGFVTINNDILNLMNPFDESLGTQNPESVLVYDGVLFFYDQARRKLVRCTVNSIKPISDVDIQSFFESKAEAAGADHRLVSGYDPADNIYYLTMSPNPVTIGWNEDLQAWQSVYSFQPDFYANSEDSMYMLEYVSNAGEDTIIHTHAASNESNSFYNSATPATSKFTVISNSTPSMVKMFKSISMESNQAWNVKLSSSLGQKTDSLVFSEKEDAFYAWSLRDKSNSSTSQYSMVGTVDSVDGNVVTFKNSLRGLHIPLGYLVYSLSGGSYTQQAAAVSSVDRANNKVTLSGPVAFSEDDQVVIASSSASDNGDQIRGHYCEIECSKSPSDGSLDIQEVYAVNANFVNSKANHA